MEWNRKLIAAMLAVCLLCGITAPAMAADAKLIEANYGAGNYKDIAVSVYARMLLYKKGNGVVAAADSSGKYGLIDLAGKPVTGFVYQKMYVLGGGLFKFQDAAGKWGVIDYTGDVKLTLDDGYYNSITCYHETVEVIDGSGTRYYTLDWTPATAADYGAETYGDDFTVQNDYDDWYYLATPSGHEKYKVKSKTDGKWGVVDENGRVIIPLQYDQEDMIGDENQNGYIAAFRADGSTDVYSASSASTTPVKTINHWVGTASYYRDFAFRGSDGKYGIEDLNGKQILPARYDAILTDWNDHLLTVTGSVARSYGLFAYDGTKVFEDGYSLLSCVGDIGSGSLGYLLGKDSKYGTATVKGTAATTGIPLEYDNMDYYQPQFIQCLKGGKYRVLNITGETILPESDALIDDFTSALNEPSLSGDPETAWSALNPIPSGYDGDAVNTANGAGSGCMPFVIKTAATESGYATYYLDPSSGIVSGYVPYRASNINDEGWFVYQDASGNYGLASRNQMPGNGGSEYVYDTTDPGEDIKLPTDALEKVKDTASAVNAVKQLTGSMTSEQKSSPTGVDLATLYAETAVSRAARKDVEGNKIIANADAAKELASIAAQTADAVDSALSSGGVTTERYLTRTITFTTEETDISIRMDPDILTVDVDRVQVETPAYALTLDLADLKEDLTESLTFRTQEGTESYALKRDGQTVTVKLDLPKVQMANPIIVSLPKSSENTTYQAVVKTDGTATSSKYNPAKQTMDGRVNTSGTYTVKTNEKTFSDISNKSAEMQKAILYLTSKGIINGTSATTFSPDGAINRQQIAALLMRALGKVDNTATTTFTDVSKSSSLYHAIASSQKHGIINGYADNTFRGVNVISRAQIVTVSGRVLTSEMNYKVPSNKDSYLGKYSDTVPEFARDMVALATREGLIVYRSDGTFSGGKSMTRGDAAIILYRLFQKIW